jgi:hypothetical protein
MKVVKHGDTAVAIIEHGWEKLYLMAQRGTVAWVPLFLHEDAIPFAEIDPVSRQVRLCAGQELLDQQEVVFHAI